MSEDIKRKLTTIVAADIVGYSSLVHNDEERTLRAWRGHRAELLDPLIDRFGGRIANTAGDSLLIEFPSAVEALRCALEMQIGLVERNHEIPQTQRIRLRIGVNVGDVIADGEDLLGDGVNVAARLEALAPPGGILLSHTVLEQTQDHVRLNLADLGKVRVKNISRPIHVYAIQNDGLQIKGSYLLRKRGKKRGLILAVLVLFFATAAYVWQIDSIDFEPAEQENLVFQLPDKPSIAVLPFENLSGDENQDFLARGFSEDVLTALSRLSGLFVISASTTAKYGDPNQAPKQVAEALGVHYVLKGNLQRTASRIRISAQLIDALSGRLVWSDRFEREFSDLFVLKDEITLKIVANVGAKLELGEQDRLRSRETRSLDAWLLQREGYRIIQQFNAEDNRRGRFLLEQAIGIDPEFATAYANLGLSYRLDYQFGWVDDRAAANQRAFELYQKALSIEPDHGAATAALASWHLVHGDVTEAVKIGAEAIQYEPNDYLVHGIYGWALIHSGDFSNAIEELRLSLRLSPRGPDWVVFKLAEAYLAAGDAALANATAEGLLQRPPSSAGNRNLTHLINALALVALGRTNEARKEVEKALDAFPRRTVDSWTKQRPYADPTIQVEWATTLKRLGMP